MTVFDCIVNTFMLWQGTFRDHSSEFRFLESFNSDLSLFLAFRFLYVN